MARSTTKNLSLEKTKQQFVAHLQERERSPHTIKGYVLDIDGFACWFVDTNGDELSPELITPIDLREYKQFLVDERELTPRSVNRKLATLKSYLSWAHHAGLIDVMPLVPKHVAYTQLAPRWLDRREQHRYLKAVHRIGKQRDIAIIEILRHTGVRRAEFCAERWIDVGITE